MKEETEIVMGEDGVLVARATWGNILIEEKLPKGFETWTPEEQYAHMRRFVAPKLKFLMSEARAGRGRAEEKIEKTKFDGELTDQDRARIQAAAEKREMRAAKRLRLVQ